MNNKEYKNQLINRIFDLSKRVITLSDKFPKKRSVWVISDQLIKAVRNIGTKIVEAQAATSNKDFANFLSYSLKIGNEAKYWLGLLKDLDVKLSTEIEHLIEEINEIIKIIVLPNSNARNNFELLIMNY